MNASMITVRATPLLLACALLLGCSEPDPASPEAAATVVPAQPLILDYVKVETAPNSLNWLGNVSGDINGQLETRVIDAWASGHVLHIDTEWIVGAGAESFEASLRGTLDSKTGRLLLDGDVTSGYLVGAQVHDEGWLTGIDASTGGTVFEGFLRLMSGSAN